MKVSYEQLYEVMRKRLQNSTGCGDGLCTSCRNEGRQLLDEIGKRHGALMKQVVEQDCHELSKKIPDEKYEAIKPPAAKNTAPNTSMFSNEMLKDLNDKFVQDMRDKWKIKNKSSEDEIIIESTANGVNHFFEMFNNSRFHHTPPTFWKMPEKTEAQKHAEQIDIIHRMMIRDMLGMMGQVPWIPEEKKTANEVEQRIKHQEARNELIKASNEAARAKAEEARKKKELELEKYIHEMKMKGLYGPNWKAEE